MPDREWMMKAACRDHDPESWFPEDLQMRPKQRAEAARKALQVCQSCPVLDQCEAYADTFDIAFGIWGGERRTLRSFPPIRRRTCGTPSGYLSHRRHRERACDPCKAAIRDESRTKRARLRICP